VAKQHVVIIVTSDRGRVAGQQAEIVSMVRTLPDASSEKTSAHYPHRKLSTAARNASGSGLPVG